MRRGRTGRGSHLRGGSVAAVRAEPDRQGNDGGGVVDGGGVDGGGVDGGGVDGGGVVECDGFGDGGEENFELGDGEAECFRDPEPELPGCGARPAGEVRDAFVPGRFAAGRFE